MRIANLSGRLSLVVGGLAVDVAEASGGTFGPDVQAVYQGFAAFRSWAQDATLPPGRPFDPRDLGAPAPSPRQLFAIGLNYREHARESGFTPPPSPAVFTKFVSSITGPVTEVELPDGQVDWEVELVVVIGAGGLWGSRIRPPVLTWDLGGPLIFADEAAEDGPALDPRLGEVGDRVVGPGRTELTAAMGPPPVHYFTDRRTKILALTC